MKHNMTVHKDDGSDTRNIIQKIVEQCREGNIWGVKSILMSIPESEHGCLLNNKDSFGDTALGAASSNGHASVVEYLLQIPDVDPNIGAEKTHFTPLILSAANGYKRIVWMLIQLPNIKTGLIGANKMTADEEAVYAGYPEIAEMIRAKK